MLPEIDSLDRPVHGARQIAEVFNLTDKTGKTQSSQTSILFARRRPLDADKLGKRNWSSTPRRLLKIPRA